MSFVSPASSFPSLPLRVHAHSSRASSAPFQLPPDADAALFRGQSRLLHHELSHLSGDALRVPNKLQQQQQQLAAGSSGSSSYSPLSLCSSVSSVSTSSSGSALSGDSSAVMQQQHANSGSEPLMFELHGHHGSVDEGTQRHLSYPSGSSLHRPSATSAAYVHHPTASHVLPGLADAYLTQRAPSQHLASHPLPINLALPAPAGAWKEQLPAATGKRRGPSAVTLDAYANGGGPVVAAAAAFSSDSFLELSGKKKKPRGMRRCMDREKHSKAEQRRRGEMKSLFDHLQEITSCVYKDRIHILTLAIQTIHGQRDMIERLQQHHSSRDASPLVKKERLGEGDSHKSPDPQQPSIAVRGGPVDDRGEEGKAAEASRRPSKKQRTEEAAAVHAEQLEPAIESLHEGAHSAHSDAAAPLSASFSTILSSPDALPSIDFAYLDEHFASMPHEEPHHVSHAKGELSSVPLQSPSYSPIMTGMNPFQQQAEWWRAVDTGRK